MPTISLFIALWALSPLAQAATTQAARKPAVLEIRVTDRMGAPLDAANVAAEGASGRKGETDKNGSVTFRSLTAGTYRFRVERQGYVPLEKEVVVTGRRDGIDRGRPDGRAASTARTQTGAAAPAGRRRPAAPAARTTEGRVHS